MTDLNSSLPPDRIAFTVDEVVEREPVGKTFIYGAIRTGALVSIKIGKKRLILRDDLVDWLKRHRVAA